jgi:uncharacterized protein YqgV (UPF0045/DUF77 family)
MVFEFAFPASRDGNGYSSYVKSLAPESGLELIEQCQSATIVEGEWDAAMRFIRRCQEYVQEHLSTGALTTIHIYN